ncbi:MAG: DUF924 family protein [Xanthomonadales bacterium]|nr:DUF924 family protein [Xanthomonadales bacterium]
MNEAEAVVAFWRDAGPARWFTKDPAFDARFRDRFLDLHERAAAGALDAWIESAHSALALVVLLDQFPRNAFRGSARMHATDADARRVAARIVDSGIDRDIEPELRVFCYLPFAHSEDLADQDRSVALMRTLGSEALAHAEDHRDIIRRFGRFPHRNAVLGRSTTPAEQAFLDSGGFAG